jgi:hypothetical protein
MIGQIGGVDKIRCHIGLWVAKAAFKAEPWQ